MNKFAIGIPVKTQFLNFFRRVFTIPWMEKQLLKFTIGAEPGSLPFRLVPSHYLYKKPTVRTVNREGINYKLEISDFVDWYIYFGFTDPGHQKLYQLCEPSYTVLDIGTNVGWVLMNLAKKVDKGLVYGFEPHPVNQQRCKINLALNHFNNTQLNPIGLGSEQGNLIMVSVNEGNLGMNRIVKDVVNVPEDKTTIQIVTLDHFIKCKEINKVDLMKIDVEGFEMEVLKGGIDTLTQHHPAMFIELNNDNLLAQGASASQLVRFVFDQGYEIYNVEGEKLSSIGSLAGKHMDIIAIHPEHLDFSLMKQKISE